MSYNYLIGSQEGIVVDFEECPNEILKAETMDGILGHGNDFVVDPSVDRDDIHPHHFR